MNLRKNRRFGMDIKTQANNPQPTQATVNRAVNMTDGELKRRIFGIQFAKFLLTFAILFAYMGFWVLTAIIFVSVTHDYETKQPKATTQAGKNSRVTKPAKATKGNKGKVKPPTTATQPATVPSNEVNTLVSYRLQPNGNGITQPTSKPDYKVTNPNGKRNLLITYIVMVASLTLITFLAIRGIRRNLSKRIQVYRDVLIARESGITQDYDGDTEITDKVTTGNTLPPHNDKPPAINYVARNMRAIATSKLLTEKEFTWLQVNQFVIFSGEVPQPANVAVMIVSRQGKGYATESGKLVKLL